jgi:phosphoribosyl-AMP cyclohydrolase
MTGVLEPRFNSDGLVPVIVQDATDGRVLMLAWMDAEAWRRTLATRQATYWSRSRQQYWVKGETSGHRQQVRQVQLDCDGDTVLLKVDQTGPACHTGTGTCFDGRGVLDAPLDGASGFDGESAGFGESGEFDGALVAGHADHVGHADHADNPDHAENADQVGPADNADQAGLADNDDNNRTAPDSASPETAAA